MSFRFILVLLGISVLLIMKGIVGQDPDFGWHLQAGNHILQKGIPFTDPFSYSMPSYPFVDHEWLTNVLWTIIFTHWGNVPLLIISILLAVGSLLMLFFISDKKWALMPLVIGGITFFDFFGVRTQLITWFFLSVLISVLFQKKLWKTWRYGLPLLFLLWANLHGGFGIGLGVLGIVLVGKMFEEKKQIGERCLILVLCVGATLINPFGIRLWWEFMQQLTDTQLRWSIEEWSPAFTFTNIASWGYLLLSVFLVIRYRLKYTRTELFLYFFLLIEALSSVRNIPIWIIIAFPFTVRGFSSLYQEASAYLDGGRRFKIAYRFFSIVLVSMFVIQSGAYFYVIYQARMSPVIYPEQAVIYLHNHLPREQVFSTYNWGGYLIWQLPEKKVFIDGRMPSWRWHANIPHESNYAFDEYKSVMIGQIPFSVFIAKYHITTLLIPKASIVPPQKKFLGFVINKSALLRKLFYSWNSFYLVVGEAKQLGWKEVYSDDTAIIYQQKNP